MSTTFPNDDEIVLYVLLLQYILYIPIIYTLKKVKNATVLQYIKIVFIITVEIGPLLQRQCVL